MKLSSAYFSCNYNDNICTESTIFRTHIWNMCTRMYNQNVSSSRLDSVARIFYYFFLFCLYESLCRYIAHAFLSSSSRPSSYTIFSESCAVIIVEEFLTAVSVKTAVVLLFLFTIFLFLAPV